jgi:hypothetical protein
MPSSASREQETSVTESDWTSSTDPQAMLTFLRGRGPVSERKLRLFGLACCRRLYHLYCDPQVVEALALVEEALDGLVEPAALVTTQAKLGDAVELAWVASYDAEADAKFCGHPADTLASATELAVYAAGRLFDDVAPSPLPRTLGRGFSNEWEVHQHAVEAAAVAAEARAELVTSAARPEELWPVVEAAREAYVARARWSELFVQADILRDIFGNPFNHVPFSPSWRSEAVVGLARGLAEEGAYDRLPVLADALEDAACADPQVLAHSRGPGPHVRGCWVVDMVLGKT